MKNTRLERLYGSGPAVVRCSACKGISTIVKIPHKSENLHWYFIVLTNVIVAMVILLLVKSG